MPRFALFPFLRRRSVAVAALFAVGMPLLVPSPLAACCDDFWSCAEAFATSGLSCAVEAALGMLRDTMDKITVQQENANAAVAVQLASETEVLDEQLQLIETELQAAMQKLQNAGAEAEKLVGKAYFSGTAKRPSLTAGTGDASAPAASKSNGSPLQAATRQDVASVEFADQPSLSSDPSVSTLKKRIDELTKEESALVAAVREKQQEAASVKVQEVTKIQLVAKNSLLQPLDNILAALQAAAANPTKIPDAVGAALGLVLNVVQTFQKVVVGAFDEMHDLFSAAAQKPAPPLAKLQATAQEADNLLIALKKTLAMKTATERTTFVQSLQSKVSPAAIPKPGHIAMTASAPKFLALKSEFASRLAVVHAQLRSLQAPLKPMDMSSFRAGMAAQLDSHFKGKSAAAARRERESLLAEAQRRFAKDPRTLAAVNTYLTNEAAARGVN